MKKNANQFLSFIFGFVFATVIFTSKQNICALGQKVFAYFCDDYKIEIDGSELKLMDGTRILNYGDRTYLSVRNIVESMGGTVKWNEANKTIEIRKPKSEVIEKIVEKTVKEPLDEKNIYNKLPLKLNKDGCSIKLTEIEKKDGLAYFYLDLKNNAGEDLILDFSNIKMSDGTQNYYASYSSSDDLENVLENTGKLEDQNLIFDVSNELKNEMTLSIPVKSANGSSYKKTFEFNIKTN